MLTSAPSSPCRLSQLPAEQWQRGQPGCRARKDRGRGKRPAGEEPQEAIIYKGPAQSPGCLNARKEAGQPALQLHMR